MPPHLPSQVQGRDCLLQSCPWMLTADGRAGLCSYGAGQCRTAPCFCKCWRTGLPPDPLCQLSWQLCAHDQPLFLSCSSLRKVFLCRGEPFAPFSPVFSNLDSSLSPLLLPPKTQALETRATHLDFSPHCVFVSLKQGHRMAVGDLWHMCHGGLPRLSHLFAMGSRGVTPGTWAAGSVPRCTQPM